MTTRIVTQRAHPPFIWLDVVQPTEAELDEVAVEYGLHATSVQDCLDPEHLPKYERIGTTTFVIVRAVDEAAEPRASSVEALTRKVAVFFGPDFLIIIHRMPQRWLAEVEREYGGSGRERGRAGGGPAVAALDRDRECRGADLWTAA